MRASYLVFLVVHDSVAVPPLEFGDAVEGWPDTLSSTWQAGCGAALGAITRPL